MNSLQGAWVLELEETLADQLRSCAEMYRALTTLASSYSGSAFIPRQPLVAAGSCRLLASLSTQELERFKYLSYTFAGTNPFSFSTFHNLVLLIAPALNLSWKTLLLPFPRAQPHTSPRGWSTEVRLRPVPPWSHLLLPPEAALQSFLWFPSVLDCVSKWSTPSYLFLKTN